MAYIYIYCQCSSHLWNPKLFVYSEICSVVWMSVFQTFCFCQYSQIYLVSSLPYAIALPYYYIILNLVSYSTVNDLEYDIPVHNMMFILETKDSYASAFISLSFSL